MKNEATMTIDTGETTIFLRKAGEGPALLLLHGFPQTHLMWHAILPLLADDFTVVSPDLRGYGQSGCPPSDAAHTAYSKRAMAKDMVTVMQQLGYDTFMVAGHDRGGRVVYRMALDHPQQVTRLAVLDIIPMLEVWDRADKRLLSFWPWSLLSQTAPFPEQLIAAAPAAIIDNVLSDWGTDPSIFSAGIRAQYVNALKDPQHAHAICEEFRAAYTIDAEHDAADRESGHRISCPLLVLWSEEGPVDTWYKDDGGPLKLWSNWADQVQGEAIKGGHFFPEAEPVLTANALRSFFHV